ncbi:MAG TPA: ferredoxin [Candidatus Omnitrophota bacterium]|mgnify:CR=1 FL=1|nr:ferredoxin [Candidatus Omnitrophota bacterium]
MKAVVDQSSCIGCGLCAQVAPDVYSMDGDKAVAVSGDLSGEVLEQAKNGADQCPVSAITVS